MIKCNVRASQTRGLNTNQVKKCECSVNCASNVCNMIKYNERKLDTRTKHSHTGNELIIQVQLVRTVQVQCMLFCPSNECTNYT